MVIAEYKTNGKHVSSVKITNVPSFLFMEGYEFEAPELGPLKIDIAYGGNFYPIVEAQANFRDMADFSPASCSGSGAPAATSSTRNSTLCIRKTR